MDVVVVFDSKTGNTERAAGLIATGLQSAGADVSVYSIDEVDLGALARADLAVIGTWTSGLFFFGQHPGGAGKVANVLPDLWDKATFAYVTYAVNAGPAAEKMGDVLDGMGAVNLGTAALHRDKLDEQCAAFVDEILAEVTTA